VFILFSLFRKNFHSTDITVNLWITSIHNDVAIDIAKAISTAFDTIPLFVASLVIAGFLFIKNHKTQSLFLLVGVGGNAMFVAIIKNLVQVARPANQLLHSSGFSYPSGHSTGVVIFIGLIVYIAWLNWSNSQRVKILSSTSFGLMVALVSFDRIYLNVHWLSDVIGGCLFGTFWLSFCILIYEHLKFTGKLVSKPA
jgi:undecaprenyl-diphosphatase